MKIFVTGATGFIGKHLVKRLAQETQERYEVCCLVRKSSRTRQLERLPVRLVYGDVNDPAALREGMQGCDCLVAGCLLLLMFSQPHKMHISLYVLE